MPPQTPAVSPPPSPYPGPVTPASLQKTTDHLRVLSICTWVAAGLQGIGLLLGLLYVGLGLVFVFNPPGQSASAQAGPPPDFFGWFMFAMGAAVVLLSTTIMVLTMMTARDLSRHRRRVFCIVIAAVHCLSFPGIVLGIFTIIVLCKPEAKVLFDRQPAAR